MKIPHIKKVFALLMLLPVQSHLLASDPDSIYEFSIPKQGNMIGDATCYAWIPEDVGVIRSVIVHLHGCTREGDARQMMYDVQWRALAKKWHSVLLAPAFVTGGNSKTCVNWYDPDNGSGAVFFQMLDTLAARARHPEINIVPWALWGHSGGSIWITSMTGKYPQRVAVAVAQSCGVDISKVNDALNVPVLHHNGIEDICHNNAELFSNGRRRGALWAHAVNPVVKSPMDGHQVHDLRFLAIPWIDACFSMRLPDKPGESALKQMDTSAAWLGDTATRAIASAVEYRGDKGSACWFPNQTLAVKWKEYMEKGTITDNTAPPAPRNVKASFNAGSIMLTWNADADLESGLKTFIVYRNGKKLQQIEYKTKTIFSDQTGYQRWNDGDQPAPVPAPEMSFTDQTAGTGKKYSYQVCSVNWSDVSSEKSEKITIKKDRSH